MLTGIRRDVAGRVPFSLIAVIALLLAGVSSAYVAMTSRDATQAAIRQEQLRSLGSVAIAVHHGVELEAHTLALEAIRLASQGPATPDRANREFARLLRERLEPSFPRSVRGFTIELDRVSAALFLQRLQTVDLLPAPPIAEDRVNWTSEALSPERPAILGETTRAPYFTMVGSVDYTVRREDLTLRTVLPLRTAINSPFPLLQATAREFRGAADGSESELARIVRYILTTAAQFRALQGYAAGQFGEPGTSTVDLLNPRDVEVAVNLALLLEQMRRFRSFDRASAGALDEAFFGDLAGRYLGDPRVPDASGRTMARLLDAYGKAGTADPADLFALYNAFDADPVRLNRVLAQALSAVIDQHVLRVFEYFGAETSLDLGIRGVEMLAKSIDDFLSWVAGEGREADLVRGFIRELFAMAGEPTTLLGPYELPMSERTFTVTNADGTILDVTIPAHDAPIEFDSIRFLEGRDPLWRSYFNTLYADDLRAVHVSAREFFTDLATNVANNLNLIGAIPNPSLRGGMDPKDSRSILEFVRESLTAAIDEATRRLRDDPSYLGSLVTNLWKAQADAVRGVLDFVETNFDTLVSRATETDLARNRLVVHLEGQAVFDPDFWSLDAKGLADLQAQIREEANGTWIALAFAFAKGRDANRLEHIYDASTDTSTPPEGGGIYRRLLDTVLGTTGILVHVADLMRAFGSSLASADDLQNTKILVPTPKGPFEFWAGNRTVAEQGHGVREEAIEVRQAPSILRITRLGDPDTWNPLGPEVGDLWVDLRDPVTVPRNRATPNVHWTDIHEMSTRPFESRWDLRVLGLLHVDAASARGIHLSPSGHLPDIASVDVPLDFSLAITIYTGWPLERVQYRDTATLAGDTWAKIRVVLGEFWERFLAPIVDRILDMIHGYVEALLDLIHRVMDSEVVRALADLAKATLDALQDFVLRQLGPFALPVELLVREVQNADLSFETLGLDVTVGPGPRPMSVRLRVTRDDAQLWATLMVIGFDREKPLSPKNSPVDLAFGFTYYADGFTLTLEGDVLAIIDGRLITGRGVPKEGGWALEFEIPAIDAYKVETPWSFTLPPIPTPLGTLTIELGVEIRYVVHTSVEWREILTKSILEAKDAVGGWPMTWEDFGLFMESFGDRLVKNLVDLVISGFVELREFVLYAEGVFGAGDLAGAGVRLAFVMAGAALIRVLEWLVHNLVEFLESFPNPGRGVEYEAFPSDLLDSFSVRIEAFGTFGLPRFMSLAGGEDVPTRVRMDMRVQPNLPALLNAWRPDAGTWRVEFGAYLEQIPAPVADVFFHTGKATPDVWFLRGSIVEVPP